jgi:C4-dicarboxylate-specific signal transduction histidine kinase
VLVKTNPNLHLISLVDTKEIALISSEAALVGRDFSSREYFSQAMRGHAYQTSIIRGVIHGERGMYYAHPVVDQGGVVIGCW